MALNLRIQATVVDLRRDRPKSSDKFLVDTNAWFWLLYPRAASGSNPPKSYQIRYYPSYLNGTRRAKSTLYRTILTLSELSHLVEKNELDIFNQAQFTANLPQVGLKEYRYNYSIEHASVVNRTKVMWLRLKSYSTNMDVLLNDALADAALQRLDTQLLDGYDLFMLETAIKFGLTNVITDDADFASVPDITVFTANANLINAATVQGKLLVR